jgi:hypothetical protein
VYNCAVPDSVPVRPETCRTVCMLKDYYNCNEVFAFCWLTVVGLVTIVS